MNIGIVGCGDISGIYLKNLHNAFGDSVKVAGVCDLIPERAQKVSEQYGVKIYKDMHAMFDEPEIEVILNITRPYEHFDVSMAAIEAGKHVYSEKPLGITLEEGAKIIEAAAKKGVRIGGAPDTFMGAGISACRNLIQNGRIGRPIGATAFMTCPGHESWHPDPEFYYKKGGGPMLDMGPYYVTALVSMLGSVKEVVGMTRRSFETRTITSRPHNGKVIEVETPTNIMGLLSFENGAIATIIQSFDVEVAHLPIIEIYGENGTLGVPDPNTFGGPVTLYRGKSKEDIKISEKYSENSRGLGLYDMVCGIKDDYIHAANEKLTLHVLEIMTSIEKSGETGKFIEIKTKI